ncbi:cytospin-A, putative [Streptomyces bingchenggensis BCW-1]|uniref:Cytospin-A, putative n=1 Tax=Streptomyces bingchenggensis (strain BCW-1) TaxID=749414 RepID=D7C5I2_STRBB|nr:cytospin-A, putative [Streptomyces bingchenggensis BCW-1]
MPTVTGSTPYSWMERGFSVPSKWISRMVLASRSTSARVVIISLTNSPLPPENSRQRVRNGALVIPAMGASTTGGVTVCGPICSCVAVMEEVSSGMGLGYGVRVWGSGMGSRGRRTLIVPHAAFRVRHGGLSRRFSRSDPTYRCSVQPCLS